MSEQSNLELQRKEGLFVKGLFYIVGGAILAGTVAFSVYEAVTGNYDEFDALLDVAVIVGLSTGIPAVREARSQINEADSRIPLLDAGQQGSDTVES
ncbi:MAG TPA: hypothetical protein VJJ78_01360 [Candidatus Saccharimonadales bacterium]|nr:hypothetical protein [Candidatus Saccharimonadales bacterium]